MAFVSIPAMAGSSLVINMDPVTAVREPNTMQACCAAGLGYSTVMLNFFIIQFSLVI